MSDTSSDTRCLACTSLLPVSSTHCRTCGFTFFTDEERSFDYEKAYDESSAYNALPPEAVLRHYRNAPNTAWALSRLRRSLHRGAGDQLLEIGASQGAFMALARELGYEVRGIELSTSSVAYGRKQLGLGSSLETGAWRHRGPEDRPVDVICAFEVLEHSNDPLDFLAMLYSWLRPGGLALVSVPNGRRLSVRLGRRESQDLPPHHFSYWTRRALQSAAERMSLEVVECLTSPLTHSDILGVLAPDIARRRATDLGSFRPVGSEADGAGLPRSVRLVYPVATLLGRLTAGTLNLVPELGSRLMLMARRSDHGNPLHSSS